MKKYLLLLILISTTVTATIAQTKKLTSKPATKNSTANNLKNLKDSSSYALGINMARSLQSQYLSTLNFTLFEKGMKDALENKKIHFTEQEITATINKYLQLMNSQKAKIAKEAGKKFLALNAKRNGVICLPDGLQYEILKAGTDSVKPTLNDRIKCHYRGTLIDGTVFDSSIDRGEPITFPLRGVIKGWQEALQLMTVGSKWKIYLPSSLAYGDNEAGDKITPGTTLIFEVELLGIEK